MSALVSAVISAQHHLVPVVSEDRVRLDRSWLREIILLELAVNLGRFV